MRQQIIQTTAEGWIDRFGPNFLQNVHFMSIMEPQKKFGRLFFSFTPPNKTFFPMGAKMSEKGAG